MRLVYALAAALALGMSAQTASAAEASVAISSPKSGATFAPKSDIEIAYKIALGDKGDHTHLYVDKDEALTLRGLEGTHVLSGLAPGTHDICIKVVNKAHTPIGAQECIQVSVQ
ncbi:hypothetical protein [Nitrosovibrio sp. Nv17]|uniref:hypothetical protein n=1 Tax=Nitrosovibrio sp. Nv17 TaxID=1855339 RepID=UPI0009084E7E|nr:hypothetical protein [Nitrosovibrio sp. Nv17]SFW14048.1 hypothetical protein SAMN05216414_102113 [Nitrosovibrio sp. Nv17]